MNPESIWIENDLVSKAFGISDRAARLRADANNWIQKFEKLKGGGRKRLYLLTSLKDQERLTIDRFRKTQSLPVERSVSPLPAITLKKQELSMAKADLLRLYTRSLENAGWGNKTKARVMFMKAYNSGVAFPELYEKIGNVSYKTIEGWKRTVAKSKGDSLALADRRGVLRKGTTSVNDEEQKVLLSLCLRPNNAPKSEIIRMAMSVMRTRKIGGMLSDVTYRRWLNEWESLNYDIWTFAREGKKAWNDKCAKDIERDPTLINVGDILVADGHVLNFEILNPWTGKPKRMMLVLWIDMRSTYPLGWEIMPTENIQSIASALRRAILVLGKIPVIVYLDNGKAFKAKFFNGKNFEESGLSGLYDRLGCKTIFAWGYHGQSKTIERFFGTFAELERWCPTYSGTSIAKKPPRMNRGEVLHRKLYDKMMEGKCLTMEQAHMAIASWFETYVNRKQKGTYLNGITPQSLFIEGKGPGVERSALDYLMMNMEIKHINKNGIRFLGENYYSHELSGRRHPVMIRYDLQDKTKILVYDVDGIDLICTATPTSKAHPAAYHLGSEKDQEHLKQLIRYKRHQERDASSATRALLENIVIPEHRKMMKDIGFDPENPAKEKPVKELSEKLSEAAEKEILKEVKRLEAMNQEQLPAPVTEMEYVPEVFDETAEVFGKLPEMREMDRYETLVEIEVRGWVVPKEYRAFMRYFEQTAEYRKYEDYFEEHRAKTAMMYQTDGYVNASE